MKKLIVLLFTLFIYPLVVFASDKDIFIDNLPHIINEYQINYNTNISLNNMLAARMGGGRSFGSNTKIESEEERQKKGEEYKINLENKKKTTVNEQSIRIYGFSLSDSIEEAIQNGISRDLKIFTNLNINIDYKNIEIFNRYYAFNFVMYLKFLKNIGIDFNYFEQEAYALTKLPPINEIQDKFKNIFPKYKIFAKINFNKEYKGSDGITHIQYPAILDFYLTDDNTYKCFMFVTNADLKDFSEIMLERYNSKVNKLNDEIIFWKVGNEYAVIFQGLTGIHIFNPYTLIDAYQVTVDRFSKLEKQLRDQRKSDM